MNAVTVSSKYQIVIPREIRERTHLKPGMKFQVINFGDCIELVPLISAQELRGLLKGYDITFEREEEDRI